MSRRQNLDKALQILDSDRSGADRVEQALSLAEAATYAMVALAAALGEVADTLRKANR